MNKNHPAQMLITIIQNIAVRPDTAEEGGGQAFNLINEGRMSISRKNTAGI